jgi:hypothetical protein
MNQENQMMALISQWRTSSLTKSAFCCEEQISIHQFNYWLKKNPQPKKSKTQDSELRFFSIEKPNIKKIPAKTNSKPTLLVELPNGIKINFY